MDELEGKAQNPVLHILVVGFHHKKGCQVEYAYPAIGENDVSNGFELPEPWKHLPSLALPDGSHNFECDTIYFHLPALENHRKTVFGISCYRQINAETLLSKSSDVTRETVQKSVCVLSTLPLYGMIQAKLELITHAYFDERDFSRVALLEETYRNLNTLMNSDMLATPQVFLSLPVRNMILQFRHKILMLFKLILLEKKVLFYKTPVKDLCTSILTLCSVFPGMIESGLSESVASASFRFACPELKISGETDSLGHVDESGDSSSVTVLEGADRQQAQPNSQRHLEGESESESHSQVNSLKGDISDLQQSLNSYTTTAQHLNSPSSAANSRTSSVDSSATVIYRGPEDAETNSLSENDPDRQNHSPLNENKMKDISGSNHITTEAMNKANHLTTAALPDVSLDQYGLPLQVFVKGSLCHPYLSLPFLDLLADVSVRSFVAGATNFLFKQKKHLFDVIVEVDEAKLDIFDNDLKRQLSLTTEDLRFADHLMQHVTEDTKDVFLDGTGWEGGDEWLRAQFKIYLLHLLRTSELADDSKEVESFNVDFMNAWKVTHNYRMWKATSHPAIFNVNPGHPFQGQLSMADMKLKISVSVLNTERGKKINQAVNNTGKVVAQTGKVVGGALTSAKSYVSSWWSNLNSPQAQAVPTSEEQADLQAIEQAEEATQAMH